MKQRPEENFLHAAKGKEGAAAAAAVLANNTKKTLRISVLRHTKHMSYILNYIKVKKKNNARQIITDKQTLKMYKLEVSTKKGNEKEYTATMMKIARAVTTTTTLAQHSNINKAHQTNR